MAITILPREISSGAEIANNFAQGVTAGLDRILTQLSQNRAQRMLATQRAPALQQLLNLASPDEALQYGYLPDTVLKEVIKQRAISNPSYEQGYKSLGFSDDDIAALQSLPEYAQKEIIKSKISEPSRSAYTSALAQLLGNEQNSTTMQQNNLNPNVQQGALSALLGSPNLNQQQATNLVNLSFQKQQRDLQQKQLEQKEVRQQQQAVEKKNLPYLTELRENVDWANRVKNIADEMMQLLESGKVSSGLKGYLPGVLQSSESQRFEALANELASLKASELRGPVTSFKLKLAQLMKPHLLQKIGTQKSLLQNILKNVDEVLLSERAREEILNEHGGKEPNNFESLIKRKIHALKKEGSSSSTKKELDSTSDSVTDTILNEAPGSAMDKVRLAQTPSIRQTVANQMNEESLPESALRNATALGTSALAGAAGAPGNLLQLGLGAGNYLTGGAIPNYEQVQNKLPISPPTSSQIQKKVSEYLPEKYLEPKSYTERYANEFVSDLATLATPFSFFGKIPFAKALKTSGVINAVQIGAEAAGLSPEEAQVAKMVTLVAPSIVQATRLGTAADKLFNIAKSNANNVEVSAKELQTPMNTLYNELKKGAANPKKDKVIDELVNLDSKIVGNKAPATDVMNLYTSINDLAKDSSSSSGVEKYLSNATKDLNKILSSTAKESFSKPFERAASINAGLNESSKIYEFLSESLTPTQLKKMNPVTLALLGVGYKSGVLVPAAAAGTVATEKVIRALQHKGIQTHLRNVLKLAAARRGNVIAKYVNDLNKAVEDKE